MNQRLWSIMHLLRRLPGGLYYRYIHKNPYYSDPLILQDRWIIEKVFKGKRNGFFIEAGASDGITVNNTYILEKKFGWKGICVEPQNHFFAKLKKNRKCICENVCLSNKQETIKFRNSSWYGGIEKFLKTQYPHKQEMWEKGALTQKKALPLVTLLKKHNAPKVIDYLSLDVEGSEYAILSSFPFSEYKILAMTIEANNPKIEKLLISKGYKLVKNPYCKVNWELHFLNNHPGNFINNQKRLQKTFK